MTSTPQLLTDPFLQLPTVNSIHVVWFTEFAGDRHIVTYGENLDRITHAKTIQLSRTREDQLSRVGNQTEDFQVFSKPTPRSIWRHMAKVTDLTSGVRVPYQVTSWREDGASVSSEIFTLEPTPKPGTPIKILLTSDHQLKPMTAANLQKVVETVGRIDAVWFAGDLVNVPDRASEWFDDHRGNALFPGLQGRAHYQLEHGAFKAIYMGGKIVQHAPMFTCIGNHEIMGRYARTENLHQEFEDTISREVAKKFYPHSPLEDSSYNTITYEEIFTLPESESAGKAYYAVSFGDVRLVVLYITNAWRNPSLDTDATGKYQEAQKNLNHPEEWGYGQIIYQPIAQGSEQYSWLEQEINSPEFKQAKFKVVMFHHPPHSLGINSVPPYTDPIPLIERDVAGNITSVRYEYPKKSDYIIRDIIPLLEAANVQLVFYGHSHLWNRFISSQKMHFLETSNVGNSYGAAWGNNGRKVPDYQEDYTSVGNPNGLEPIVPTIAPLLDTNGQKMPYIASNEITVFSILEINEVNDAIVSSYRFDTTKPDAKVIKFDEFNLNSHL